MRRPPAYQRVAQQLREEINSGIWAPGDRLPSEHELVRLHGVSRNTIRQALQLLASANVVQRHQGRGTFVAQQGLSHVLGDLRSLTDVMRGRGLSPGIADIEIGVDRDPPLAAREFLRDSRSWRISRLRTGDGRPFCLMDSWLPEVIGSQVAPDQLMERQSLYAILSSELGVHPHEATEIIKAEPASRRDAEALALEVGSPLISIYRWTSDTRGLPVEYVRSASPGDRYQYVVKLRG